MGSQVKIEGNEAKTKTMIQALVPFFMVLTCQRGPYRYISSQALCISTYNSRNHVFHQQQLRHSKLYILQATLRGFSAEFDCDASAGVTPTGATAVSTTSCSVLKGCAHHARGRLAFRCLKPQVFGGMALAA